MWLCGVVEGWDWMMNDLGSDFDGEENKYLGDRPQIPRGVEGGMKDEESFVKEGWSDINFIDASLTP